MPVHLLRRNNRRYAVSDFFEFPYLTYEDYESQTLGAPDPANGWVNGGKVFTYAGGIASEDFETSTLTNNTPPGPDFGWTGAGLVYTSVSISPTTPIAGLGATVTLTVTPSGPNGFTYQWYKGGVAMTNGGEYSGVTTSAMTITGVTAPDYTTYYCIVTFSGSSSVQSSTVTLIDWATDWSNRVVTNGGAAPAAGTVTAIRTFVNGLISDGVWSKLAAVNVLAPDNLIAAGTPLVKGAGLDPWTNHNFAIGDLSINGLIGNGSSKYFATGVIPGSTAMTSTSAGLIAYVYTDDATTQNAEWGVNGALNSSAFDLYTHYNTSLHFASAWRFVNAGSDCITSWTTPSPAAGYYSMQRTTASLLSVFFANSGAAHTTLATATGAQTGSIETGAALFAFAVNSAGSPADFSRKRLSFMAATIGLSSADDSALYARVQQLRTDFGGGFV